MNKKLTAIETNEKEWYDHWENMMVYLKSKLKGCIFTYDLHAIGVSYNKKYYQIYGAEESFELVENNIVTIKAENLKTGKFIRVYRYNIKEKGTVKCSNSRYIFKQYDDADLDFLQSLKRAVADFYQPNSIKFIIDSF